MLFRPKLKTVSEFKLYNLVLDAQAKCPRFDGVYVVAVYES